MLVVVVSLLSLGMTDLPGAGPLRLLRCFRVFRLFKRIPSLRQVGAMSGRLEPREPRKMQEQNLSNLHLLHSNLRGGDMHRVLLAPFTEVNSD